MYPSSQTIARVKDAHCFNKARCRLTRPRDRAQWFGWMHDFRVSSAAIRLNGHPRGLSAGDGLVVELTGKENAAAFACIVESIDNDLIVLGISRSVSTLPKPCDARVRMMGHTGLMKCEGHEFQFALRDVSENGMGIISTTPLEAESTVGFEVDSPIGKMTGQGEVRFCRKDAGTTQGIYLLGIRLIHTDRVGKARWLQLHGSVWEESS